MFQAHVAQEIVRRDAQHLLRLAVEVGSAHADVGGQLVHCVFRIVHVLLDGLHQTGDKELFVLIDADVLGLDADRLRKAVARFGAQLEEAVDALVVVAFKTFLTSSDVAVQAVDDEGCGRQDVEQSGPPGEPPGGADVECLGEDGAPGEIARSGLSLKTIAAGRQGIVAHGDEALSAAGRLPVAVDACEAVAIARLLGGGVVEVGELQVEIVLVVGEMQLAAVGGHIVSRHLQADQTHGERSGSGEAAAVGNL